jgi:hypothetical protein
MGGHRRSWAKPKRYCRFRGPLALPETRRRVERQRVSAHNPVAILRGNVRRNDVFEDAALSNRRLAQRPQDATPYVLAPGAVA